MHPACVACFAACHRRRLAMLHGRTACIMHMAIAWACIIVAQQLLQRSYDVPRASCLPANTVSSRLYEVVLTARECLAMDETEELGE